MNVIKEIVNYLCDEIEFIEFAIPTIISIIAVWFTGYQQCVSNKQFLFDKRLSLYRMYKTLIRHQNDAMVHFQENTDSFCVHDLLIHTLTNDSKLSSFVKGWDVDTDLLSSENQNLFLSMIEDLRICGDESRFVFGRYGESLYDYFNKYADLLFNVYQYRIYYICLRDENNRCESMTFEVVQDKQKPLHEKLHKTYYDLCSISKSINISKLEKSILFIKSKLISRCK